MKKSFTLRELEQLAASGFIRGYTEPEKAQSGTDPQKKGDKGKKGQKIKNWIALNLWHFCRANGLTLETEVQFMESRKWRADWMLTGKGVRIAVEYEGIVSQKSRHTSLTGYTADTEKYTEMAKAGIICIRLTALNYKELNRHLEQILNKTV